MKSENIDKLALALSKAQGQMSNAKLDGFNPRLKSKYAKLQSIIAAAKKPCSENGLAYTQLVDETENGMILSTLLIHESGQWLQSNTKLGVAAAKTSKGGGVYITDEQAFGIQLTYKKRYALAAILGISGGDEDTDNDGESGHDGRPPKQRQPEKDSSKAQAIEQAKKELGGFKPGKTPGQPSQKQGKQGKPAPKKGGASEPTKATLIMEHVLKFALKKFEWVDEQTGEAKESNSMLECAYPGEENDVAFTKAFDYLKQKGRFTHDAARKYRSLILDSKVLKLSGMNNPDVSKYKGYFSDFKKKLGEVKYRAILNQYGHPKSNTVVFSDDASVIIDAMKGAM